MSLICPEPFWDSLRKNPRQAEIKRLLSYNGRFALAQVYISLVEGALEVDEEGLLSAQLAAEEIKRYRSFTYSKRRLEWFAGRIVAKAAVRIYLNSDIFAASAVRVQSLPDSSPCVTIDDSKVAALPYISISHSANMAVAVAAENPGLGIDTEEIAESTLEIAKEFSTDEELKLIAACTGFMKAAALTTIWVMKEASRKAAGCEACSMRELIIKKAQIQGDYIISELYHANTGQIKAVAFQSDNYIYAVSMLLDKEA